MMSSNAKLGETQISQPLMQGTITSATWTSHIETRQCRPSLHDDAFSLLCDWIDLKLGEGRAIEIVNLLSRYQKILEEKE